MKVASPPEEILRQYRRRCGALGVEENSALVTQLAPSHPNTLETYGSGSEMDTFPRLFSLENNFLGSKGLQAALPVLIGCSHCLHTVCLRRNGLNNDVVMDLAYLFHRGFPSLKVVDLSGNLFTYRAAKSLADMCEGIRPLSYPIEAARELDALAQRGALGPGQDLRTPYVTDAALPKLLHERLSRLGLDNQIQSVIVSDGLLTPVQEESVRRRIHSAIARRTERRRRYQLEELRHSAANSGTYQRYSSTNRRSFASPVEILNEPDSPDSSPHQTDPLRSDSYTKAFTSSRDLLNTTADSSENNRSRRTLGGQGMRVLDTVLQKGTEVTESADHNTPSPKAEMANQEKKASLRPPPVPVTYHMVLEESEESEEDSSSSSSSSSYEEDEKNEQDNSNSTTVTTDHTSTSSEGGGVVERVQEPPTTTAGTHSMFYQDSDESEESTTETSEDEDEEESTREL